MSTDLSSVLNPPSGGIAQTDVAERQGHELRKPAKRESIPKDAFPAQSQLQPSEGEGNEMASKGTIGNERERSIVEVEDSPPLGGPPVLEEIREFSPPGPPAKDSAKTSPNTKLMTTSNSSGAGPMGFRALNFKDPGGIAQKLMQQATPVHSYLYNRLSDQGKYLICTFTPTTRKGERLIEILIREFDRLIMGELIFDEDRWAGVELRAKTRKLLGSKTPDGALLNRLLLEDCFADELWFDVSRKVVEIKESRIGFTIRCEVKVLVTKVSVKYRIYYTTSNGPQSEQVESLESAKEKIQTLADKILSGEKPLTKEAERDLKAKADAYDQIVKKLSRLQLPGLELILDALEDFVAAQLKLGLGRSLLDFMVNALQQLEKDVQPTLLPDAEQLYAAFVNSKDIGQESKSASKRDVKQFTRAAPGIIMERETKTRPITLGAARSENPKVPLMTDILMNDVQEWLNRAATDHDTRRHKRANLVTFFKYCRDGLHALRPNSKTAAELVPVPKPPTDQEEPRIPVLEPQAFWTLMFNLQDLDSVFLLALGGMAGLHFREILSLDWEDILWDDEGEIEVKVAPGKGKNRRRKRKPRYILAKGPLRTILLQGRQRTGRIIRCREVVEKIKRLAERLGIKWEPSVLRHTFASCRLGEGTSEKDVATEMGSRETTVEGWYIEPTPRRLARLLWIAPFNLHRFLESLPDEIAAWDWNAPLKQVPGSKLQMPAPVKVQTESATAATTPAESPRAMLARLRNSHSPHGAWPSNIEFLVMVWNETQTRLAAILGYSTGWISARITLLRIPRPDVAYWINKRVGCPVKVPEVVRLAEKLIKKSPRVKTP